jgi:class 3 adenylate cyclase/PAS domain-containing protein
MSESARSRTAQAELKLLSRELGQVIETLRAHREHLRQYGMSLPPGTLNGLKSTQDDLDNLSERMSANAIELEQLRALADTTALINSSLDIDQVLNEVMDTVIQLTGAERGYIMLRNETTGSMEYRIARNLDRETIDESGFIVSRTIVQSVAESGEPVVTTNASSDPRFSSQQSVMIHALRSILCVPLIARDRMIGVAYADNRIKDALFGEKELSLLVAFANQAAIAIENASLFNHMQLALTEITEIKELMDNVFASITSGVITTDINEIITSYNEAAERILEALQLDVMGIPIGSALPMIYTHVRDLIDVVTTKGCHETLELDFTLPERGEVNLNLKLTPLKNEDVTEGVAIVVDDLTEIKRRDATLDVVRRYLPPGMVDNIASLDELGLGGKRRLITSMFVETRPFFAFPPDLTPQEVMEMLNLYLTVGADAIHIQNGVIDKFMGNEIMGLFNTQLNPSEDHAWWAIQSALKMHDEYMELAVRIGEKPVPFYRMGIHTGIATMGNVGSRSRRNFTAIGDSVNLAKRLQENARPGQIIISEDTYQHCQEFLKRDNSIKIQPLSPVQVKGRSQATRIYEVKRA